MTNLRFLAGRYTDADVLALYMKYRESGIGPFVREVGDFIAHAKRDRGATLDKTTFMFSQLAFFQQYQGKNKKPLDFFGDCPWWLKRWLVGNIEIEPQSILKSITGLKKDELKKEVATWFEGNQAYPTEITCKNPRLFFDLATRFSGRIIGQDVFSAASARREISTVLKQEDIPQTEVEPIIVATTVLLQGKTTEIVKGFSARIQLSNAPRRSSVITNIVFQKNPHAQRVRILPDGNLKISVITQNNTDDGLVPIGLDFLDAGIDTEKYFCRSLIEIDAYGFPKLNLATNIALIDKRVVEIDG